MTAANALNLTIKLLSSPSAVSPSGLSCFASPTTNVTRDRMMVQTRANANTMSDTTKATKQEKKITHYNRLLSDQEILIKK